MKKRFLSLCIFAIAVVTLLSSVFYYAICEGLRHAKRDAVGKFNYLIHDTTYYNTVFIGSSTMHVDINPLQFDSITGFNSFNGGMDGMGIAEVNMLVPKYIKSHGAPQQIFLNCDESTLGMKNNIWYFPQYYPFINDPDMKEVIAIEPRLLFGKYFSPAALMYMDDPLKSLGLIGLLKDYNKTNYDIPLRGGVMKEHTPLGIVFPKNEERFTATKRGLTLLEETIAYCRSNNVAVTILFMPRFTEPGSPKPVVPFLNKLKAFETKYGVRVLDYTNDSGFESKELFHDPIHLSKDGGALFTSILAKEFTVK